MRLKQSYLIVAFATLILLTSVPFVTAQGDGIEYQYTAGIASMTTDDIGVKVTAFDQVPHFHWWNASSPGNDYHVMFLKLFEANDTNNDGKFNPESDRIIGIPYLLPSTNWVFSDFEIVEENSLVTEVHFNFTTTTAFTPSLPTLPIEIPESFDVTIQIRVHVDTGNPHEMKFDIVISGWTWIYADSILVFGFTVTESAHGVDQGTNEPASVSLEGNRFSFNEGYMVYAEQAQAGESIVQVQGTQGLGTEEDNSESIYLAFEYFGEETLEYDPILGITTGEGGNGFGIDYSQLLLLTAGVSVVIFVLLLARIKR
ncbi:hypothetical protein EU527_15980 [Candidatus Thorarchaeota archaeon]|nr:MAG: hypothetical protein EU527_15980 [Candidatus Thorarchaeota archaeon]